MRKTYSLELLILWFAGISGEMIFNGNLLVQTIGLMLLLLNSYFLVSKFKKEIILEYVKLSSATKNSECKQ